MNDIDDIIQTIFHEKQNISKTCLGSFLTNPREKQIHDLRVSVRRLESIYSIIPNSSKRKKIDIFVSSYQSLFKKNNLIRDLDVIIIQLLKNNLSGDDEIIKYIIDQKNEKLKDILNDAKKIIKLNPVELKKIKTNKILKKYFKMIDAYQSKIQMYLPIVVSDESRVKELHSLRKNAKKLRYILEIIPDKSYSDKIEKLKLLQKSLGAIHDCDITINFLEQYSKKDPVIDNLILQENKIRSQIYNDFIISSDSKIE